MIVEHVTDLLPEYALDLLVGVERTQVEVHLPDCQPCSTELAHCQQLFADLPLALKESTPPPELRARLMQAVANSQKPLPVRRFSHKPYVTPVKRSVPAWGITALALVVLLAFSNLFLWQQFSRLRTERSQAMPVIALSGVQAEPDAQGTIVMSTDGKYGTLVVSNLTPLNYNQQYQLWLIKDGQRSSGGVFSVDYSGYGALIIHSAVHLADYDDFGVTVEPYGGSPGPTGERVLGRSSNG